MLFHAMQYFLIHLSHGLLHAAHFWLMGKNWQTEFCCSLSAIWLTLGFLQLCMSAWPSCLPPYPLFCSWYGVWGTTRIGELCIVVKHIGHCKIVTATCTLCYTALVCHSHSWFHASLPISSINYKNLYKPLSSLRSCIPICIFALLQKNETILRLIQQIFLGFFHMQLCISPFFLYIF